MRFRAPLRVVILIALTGLAVDQASKVWAFSSSSDSAGPREGFSGFVATVPARNDGAVANLAGGNRTTAMICALNGLIMLGASLWSFRNSWRLRGREPVFVGLLSAGMLGNSIDRLALGYVRDFLVTALWPALIFNLADVFIVVGFLLLFGSWAVSHPGRAVARGWRGWSSP